MTSINVIDPLRSLSSLSARVGLLRRRAIGAGVAAGVGWGLTAGLALLMACAWLDLALDLPGAVRAACGIVAIVLAFAVLARLVAAAMRASSPLAMAKRLDVISRSHGQILSGVDLLITPPAEGAKPITAGLARIASRRASELVAAIAPAQAVPLSAWLKPFGGFVFLLSVIGITGAISPRMVSTQWLRFADPFGDHPPFSWITIDVNPKGLKVVYGGSVDLRATLDGGVSDRADVVIKSAGSAEETVPMFPDGDNKWRATLANVVSPGAYFVRANDARSERFDLTVITVPKLENVSVRVTLPAYTHRPPYEGPIPQNGLEGLPGTRVELRARSNRPLSAGTVSFMSSQSGASTQPAPLTLTPSAPGSSEVAGSFEIRQSGKIEIGVTDVAGQPSTDRQQAAVTLLKDARPFVRIIEPRSNSFATPDAMIKVLALAEDDYGISKLEIYRGLNASTPRPMPVAVPALAPTEFPANLDLPLSNYGLNPGDVITLFARVEDNDPAGAKGSESPVTTVRIVSREDMDRMMATRNAMEMLQSKYAQAQRRLETLNEEIKKLQEQLAKEDPKSPLAQADRDKLAKLSDDLARAAGEVEKFAQHDLPFDIDKKMTQDLKNLAQAMKEASEIARDAAKPGIGTAGALDQLKKMQEKLGQEGEQFKDKTTAPLEYLAQIFPLIEDQSRFIDLYKEQKDLADRMAAISARNGQDDPQLKGHMRDLEDEQRKVRDNLRQLMDDIDDHVAKLPDDKRLDDLRHTAKTFADAVRASSASGQMQAAEQSLDDFAGGGAWQSARAAADTLDQFIARAEESGQNGRACLKFQPALAEGLGNTVDQMLAAAGLPSGMGQGSGGGYSAMRSSLENVGLYGSLPVASQASGGGGKAQNGTASEANGIARTNPNAARNGGDSKLHASGGSEAPVPAQYKRRVGEYFQRVSDELEQ